ncbi:hypothetical protein GBA52_026955 [Prunus armeniaca]|nr:hypothetical protein GBA52_026955 [Prunus armeniaca]
MSESISGTILPFFFRLNHHVNCYNRFFVLFCPNHVPPPLKPLKTARATSEYLLSTSACTCQVWCKACAHATLHASAGHALLDRCCAHLLAMRCRENPMALLLDSIHSSNLILLSTCTTTAHFACLGMAWCKTPKPCHGLCCLLRILH